jgi:hypothetical protein
VGTGSPIRIAHRFANTFEPSRRPLRRTHIDVIECCCTLIQTTDAPPLIVRQCRAGFAEGEIDSDAACVRAEPEVLQ